MILLKRLSEGDVILSDYANAQADVIYRCSQIQKYSLLRGLRDTVFDTHDFLYWFLAVYKYRAVIPINFSTSRPILNILPGVKTFYLYFYFFCAETYVIH